MSNELERVVQWMLERSYATGHGDTIEDLLGELEWQINERLAVEGERALECAAAIAKPCETGEDAALEIRSLALGKHLERKR